jgi:hypothetical protein
MKINWSLDFEIYGTAVNQLIKNYIYDVYWYEESPPCHDTTNITLNDDNSAYLNLTHCTDPPVSDTSGMWVNNNDNTITVTGLVFFNNNTFKYSWIVNGAFYYLVLSESRYTRL